MKCGDFLKDTLKLRQVNIGDKRNLFDWRNDVLTRKNSLNTEMVEWKNHCRWFENIVASHKLFFLLEDNHVPVGQVRIDVIDGIGVVNYSIAPDKRGLGYGKNILKLCEFRLREQNMNFLLRGVVKRNNIASRKIFLSLNYTEQENENCFIYEKVVS